ncbi:thioesterase II family protein [Streptomyces sp. NRRL S-340]|uniref:thioesterase II family protein n=1 Tax=Streptomyces sp. NRRL S-340 TaxID=1463901 RepID=UPI000AB97BD3|nr:alpha/beta fold hydrolase [Streptomyces sp. NRRL S-340]
MSSYPLHRPDARLWFDRRFRSATATHSLYCFPFAGGSATYYADWAPHCASPIELVPVQLPGRGGRMTEPSAKDLVQLAEEIADTIAAEPTRTLLYGHSMGAMLAFEVSRRLQTLNRPVRHLFVSGRPAPTIVRPVAPVSPLPRAEFIQMLRDYGAADQTVFEHDELLDLLLPMIRADFAMIENYRYHEGPRLSCPISAWCGDADPEVPPTAMRGWGDQTSGEFTLSVLRGGHFFLNEHRAEIMRAVHGAIRRVR